MDNELLLTANERFCARTTEEVCELQIKKAEPIIRKQVADEIKRELEKKFAIHARTQTPMIAGRTIKWWQAFWERYKDGE